jgi:uncharacterized protein YndB with AHSA1/START domain
MEPMSSFDQGTARRVERSILLDAGPEEVWDALTRETLLADWLAPEVEIDPRPGGSLLCREEDGSERRGKVTTVDDGRRIEFEWSLGGRGESHVALVLDAVGDRTRLKVVETAASPLEARAGIRWSHRLEGLRRCLASLAYA